MVALRMNTLPLTLSISRSSSAGRSLAASMLPAFTMPASNTFMHCHCSPSKTSGTLPYSFFHAATNSLFSGWSKVKL